MKRTISYSRADVSFADQLDATLTIAGFSTSLDRVAILGGEEWKRRLQNLIRDADTVAFVLSPTSAVSENCHWEVEETVRLGKRIIPIVAQPLGDAKPPEHLTRLTIGQSRLGFGE